MTSEDYKKLIIAILDGIDDQQSLISIYTVVKELNWYGGEKGEKGEC